MATAITRDVRWAELKEEARALVADIGVSGRQHHSLLQHGAAQSGLLDAIRAQGVPAEHREWVWPLLLHTPKQQRQRQVNALTEDAGLGAGMAALTLTPATLHAAALGAGASASAGVDVDVTAREMGEASRMQQAEDIAIERFNHLNPFQERKIKRILLAYAKSKPEFYYCHGMVEICVVLSTFLDEDDAFWVFQLLLEELLPKYHEESIVDFQIDCLVVQALLEKQDPSLMEHFARVGVEIQVLCAKWFFSLFAESMPFDLVCRLYDILLVDLSNGRWGCKIIFATAVAVFMYLSEMLQEMHDASVIVEVICEFCMNTLSDYSVAETFVDLVLFLHDNIQDDTVQDLRRKFKTQLEREERKRNTKSARPHTDGKARRRRRKARRSIKLIIEWGQDEDGVDAEQHVASSSASNEDVEIEIVATPSENEVLAKLHQGLGKINRRRSRTSSLRNVLLLGSDSGSRRGTSLSGSVLGSADFSSDDEATQSNGDNLLTWDDLKRSRNKRVIVQHSMDGIPDEHRSWVWPILLNQGEAPKNFPREFPPAVDVSVTDILEPEVLKAIENDVVRTRNVAKNQFAPMRRVLQAFAARNRRVGYCQGMNEILAVLLKYLDERNALLALTLLVEVILPAYHVDSMIGLHTDCAVMDTLLKQNDVEMHGHIHALGLNMEILCTKWLVTCYLTSLPPYCGLCVIDMLFARVKEKRTASRVLLGVGLTIFFTLRDAVLAAKDAGEVLMAINEYFAEEKNKSIAEMETFLAFCCYVIEQLKPEIVEEFRLVHKDEVMERFALFEAKKIEMRQQMEQARRRSDAAQPPSPARSDGSSGSCNSNIRSNGKRSGLSSYINRTRHNASRGDEHDNPKDMFYQRVDVVEANRGFAEDLAKMEEQLEDLSDLFMRGKIDEKENSCIKEQIIRRWCKGVNSPQSAMLRAQTVKSSFGHLVRRHSSNTMARNGLPDDGDASARPRKTSVSSLYKRMRTVKKSAIAILKATFD